MDPVQTGRAMRPLYPAGGPDPELSAVDTSALRPCSPQNCRPRIKCQAIQAILMVLYQRLRSDNAGVLRLLHAWSGAGRRGRESNPLFTAFGDGAVGVTRS